MIFYSAIGSDGREVLVTTQAEAKAINREFHQVDVPTDKPGLQVFIQRLMDAAQSHGEAGGPEKRVEGSTPFPPQPTLEPAKPSYSEISIAIDDAWAELPISRKLHFAARAMDEFRSFYVYTRRKEQGETGPAVGTKAYPHVPEPEGGMNEDDRGGVGSGPGFEPGPGS